MKKKALTFCLALVLLLCGCADSGKGKSPAQASAQSADESWSYDKALVGEWTYYEDGAAVAVYVLADGGESHVTVNDGDMSVPFDGEWYIADGKLNISIKYLSNPTELLTYDYRVSASSLYLTTEDGTETRLVKTK